MAETEIAQIKSTTTRPTFGQPETGLPEKLTKGAMKAIGAHPGMRATETPTVEIKRRVPTAVLTPDRTVTRRGEKIIRGTTAKPGAIKFSGPYMQEETEEIGIVEEYTALNIVQIVRRPDNKHIPPSERVQTVIGDDEEFWLVRDGRRYKGEHVDSRTERVIHPNPPRQTKILAELH